MAVIVAVLALLAQGDLESLAHRYDEERDLPSDRRAATLERIGALRTDEAAAFLGRAFETEKDGGLRRLLLACLADCGTEEAVRRLVAAARGEGVPLELRQAAVEALGRTGSKTSFDFLAECARSGGALRSRAFASLLPFPLEGTEALWRGALEDPDPEIRGLAFRKLAPLRDRRVLELARKALQDRFEPAAARMGAVAVWRAHGGAEAVRLLLPAAAGADPELGAAIAAALGSVEGDRAAEAVFEGLRDPSPEVRRVVVEALGRLRHPRAVQRLEGALRDREVEVRLAAVEALAARKDPKAEELLRREAQRSEGETVFAAIRALGRNPSEESLKLLGRLAAQGGVEGRVTALEALGEAGAPEALPLLGQALKAREWPVRVVAVRQLARFRVREAVDLLVERMPKEEGRLVGEIAEALKQITGRGPIYSPVHWKDWWAVHRETFSFEAPAEAAAGGVGVTTYHGIPVVSLRIIFCLDISGSMDSPLGLGAETRLQMAKKELARTLASLDRAAKANLIFFDDRVEPWMRELVSVKANLPRALELIEAAKPRGGTNIGDTLAFCFTDASVDTIFLLSDGEPTAGKFTAPEDILREVRRMNRARQIAIHTISLGPSPFLKRLAEENGGRYREVRTGS